MRKYFKTGILLFILVVPVLTFIFLKTFGQNHYTVKTFHPLDVVTVKSGSDTVFYKVPFFSFSSQGRKEISSTTFDNSFYIASFINSTDSDIITSSSIYQLSRIQDTFEKNSDIKIICFVLHRDSVHGKTYEANFESLGIQKDKWSFVYLDEPDFKTPVKIFKLDSKGIDVIGSSLKDSFPLVLVDKSKHIRGYYNGADAEEIDRLILEIKILLYEEDSNKSI